jgi:selenide,water dikinase
MAVKQMCMLNDIGLEIAQISGVNAVTDVTGFGIAGHLLEVCRGSNVAAEIYFNDLPLLPNIQKYIDEGCVPGGTIRNYDSYGSFISKLSSFEKAVVCDPQTSGGLLVTVSKDALPEFDKLLVANNTSLNPIGKIIKSTQSSEAIIVR